MCLRLVTEQGRNCAKPFIRQDLLAKSGRVDAVPNPIGILPVTLIGFIHCLLEMRHRKVIFFAKLCHQFGAGGPNRLPLWVAERSRDHFAQDYLRVGECRDRVSQELVVTLLKLMDIVSIIDANEDAEQIRMNIKRVFLPAGGKITDLIAADSMIDEGDLAFGIQRAVFCGDKVGITLTKSDRPVSAAISDGVTLEQNAAADWKHWQLINCASERLGCFDFRVYVCLLII